MMPTSIQSSRMQSESASLALLAFMALNIGLGGSIFASPFYELVLQLTGCIGLLWCVADTSLNRLSIPARWVMGIGLGVVGIGLVQLLPLPALVWANLPGRDQVVDAYVQTGTTMSQAPLSLAPEATLAALLWLVPPAATFLLTAKLDWRAVVGRMRWSMPLFAAISAILGIAQLVAPDPVNLYLHAGPVRGHAAGLFQVVNYQPTFLLMAIPFIAVLAARLDAHVERGDAFHGQAILLLTLTIVLLAGVVVAGSVAGYLLTLPVLLASFVVALPRGLSVGNSVPLLGGLVALGAGAIYLAGSPLLASVASTSLSSGPLTRFDTWSRASEMAQDYFPTGAGVGAFRDALGAYEDPATVTNKFVAHAHNDYLELVAELGLPGVLLIVAGVGWWITMTVVIWRGGANNGSRTRKAASIAVGVVLLHSIVDSPARTETIACATAFCLGLMASGPRRAAEVEERPRPVMAHRHIEL